MVAQHYRWDFYGLSTDSKPDATNPKVANGSTYYEADPSKLYVWYNDQWYEKEAGGGELPIASADTLGGIKVGEGLSITEAGVLSASGGGGGSSSFRVLTADDLVDGKFQLWTLDSGVYVIPHMASTLVYATSSDDYWSAYQIAIVSRNSSNPSGNGYIIFIDYSEGAYIFNVSFLNGSRISKGKIVTE